MFLTDVVNRGTPPLLEKALAFTEARHRVLTENIANADTPGYRTKHLDVAGFQDALKKALERRTEDPSGALELPASREFHTSPSGNLVVTPSEEPPENILFHDGTNGRLERQMAMLAENSMMHQVMTELLREKYKGVMDAIKGRVS
jgi:flagellar basal-body rod protein FlgB